ncbi:APC family permease [Streptomyces sp. NBC_00094]|uniref:APC family permease n=1 Tax=Streptomyces sp. NBC_00094 TaxID=2903620 RepID=UPI00224D1F23|nr:APC family permease [Streptomyces sp. NBC_00094]MCX5389200.1 APC family permease [Streptomyces sp. NBC_00094]
MTLDPHDAGTTGTTDPGPRTGTSAPPGKGLRSGSVGLLGAVALGLSSTAPAYSLAVTLGLVTMTVGHLAPAALLIGFVPILLTAFAFRELNRDMPDCGTTFVWNTRAFGPWVGWLVGSWVPTMATLFAMTALAQVGATYLLAALGLDTLAGNDTAVTVTALVLLGGATVLARRGLQIATGVQYVLLALQLVALFGLGIAAFARPGAAAPSLSWLNPFAFDGAGPFAEAVLLCLFIYWGWDALITVNEETSDADRVPGRAVLISTFVLLGTYLFTAFAAVGYAGTGTTGIGLGNPDNATDVLAALAPPLLGGAMATGVQLAVCVSALSAMLTCLVGSPRGFLSMTAHGALPKAFGRVHPRYRTPAVGTVFFGAATAVALVVLKLASPRFLGDAILSIGLLIACYYGATAFACVWHFRHRLNGSARDLLFKGVLPLLGGLMMLAALARSAYDMVDAAYGSTSFHGVGGVFLLGVGAMVLGLPVVVLIRARHPRFFREGRTSVAPPTPTESPRNES